MKISKSLQVTNHLSKSYVNNEYADELKSFRELKQFNRSQPDIVDNWLECFNNFRMKHKALFAAFMNTDNYRKMRLGNKVICRYSDDELDEMGQELYIRIVTPKLSQTLLKNL